MGAFLKRHDIAIAVTLVAVWTAAQIVNLWGSWSVDMSAIYMAGHFAWLGEDAWIYGAPPDFFSKLVPERWTEVLIGFGLKEEFAVPFVYPPIWAFLVAPMAGTMDPITFFDITRVVTTGAFGASILVAWRLMRPAGISATAFCVVSIVIASLTVPYLFSVSLNQPQFLVVLLILLAFERYQAGKPLLAGILLGVVAAMKISPVLLCLIFVADRQWRAVAACGLTAAGIAALSLAVAGWDLHMTFLERATQIEGLVPLIGFNMTFETMMYDFFVPMEHYENTASRVLGQDTPWVSALSKMLLIAAIWGTFRVTRGVEETARLKVRLILLYLAVVWFGPLAWMHYYTLPLLLAPGLIGIWTVRQVALITGAMTLGFMKPVMLGVMDWTLDAGDYQIFYAQHTALFPLLAFAGMLVIWSARQGAKARPRGDALAA